MTIVEKITQKRIEILIHSYIYYWLGDNVISDDEFDRRGKVLTDLQNKHPFEASQAEYAYAFRDYGENKCYSGFNLPYREHKIITAAVKLLKEQQ